MNWYKVKYRLPVNAGSKPETVGFRARDESDARRFVTDHFVKCRGAYGLPEIISVESFESWEDIKLSVMGGQTDEKNK